MLHKKRSWSFMIISLIETLISSLFTLIWSACIFHDFNIFTYGISMIIIIIIQYPFFCYIMYKIMKS